MNKYPGPIFLKDLKNISWIKIYAREYGVQYSEMALLCLSPKAKYHIHSPSVNQVVIPEQNNTAFYIDKNSWNKLVESLNTKYTLHLSKLEEYEKGFIKDGTSYLDFCRKISRENFGSKTDRELLCLYQEYQEKLFAYSVYAWTSFILNNYVADRATGIVDKYIHKSVIKKDRQEIINSLFFPEKKAVVKKLQNEIGEKGSHLSTAEFHRLYEQYKWLSCLDLHNDPWTEKQFWEAINTFRKQSSKKCLPFSQYARQLQISSSDLHYLQIAKRFVYIKDARDDFRRQGVYFALPLFAEIAKRLNIKTKDISYATSAEITGFLKEKIPLDPNVVKERKKAFIMYLDYKKQTVCVQGSVLPNLLKQYKLIDTDEKLNTIKGTVASRGKSTGIVAIVRGIKDLPKIKHGSILVTITTHPDYTVAMRRAAAIITDEGGITSHAAIVSREYGLPCIVGTKNATKILKDGDKVKVDAVNGQVIIIR